ncbi:MAG: PDZ domain-containing protein [Saprospiraceae bacterium]
MRLLLVALLTTLASVLLAQTPITYTLDLTDINHHELGIEIDFPALGPAPLVVVMPTASPGRYAEHNFAKNVYNVRAQDGQGREIAAARTGVNEWTVSGHGGAARFSYTLYANRADGTYAKVDNRKLHLNMPAIFAYGRDMADRPIELVIPADQRPEWKVATQLQRVGPRRFRAPDYYYFYDSPTMVGDIRYRSWTVPGAGRTDTIEMAFLCPDTEGQLDSFADWTKSIVEQERRVYGELPAFDYGRYTFLCAYNPYVSGDGMEHRNSTVCSSSSTLVEAAEGLIGTVAHEFFHCWNVERIRPASLEPFDFDRANQSGELWFAEGFTSYYDDLSLVRAGVLTPEDYVDNLTGQLNYVLLRPGREYRNPIEMSRCAPFVDAATSIDPNNFANTFVSYYPYGATVGLGLDLLLRRDHSTTLDRLMQRMWTDYGKTEVPYEIPDIQRALAETIGDSTAAARYFEQYVYDSQLPDLKMLFADYGIGWEVERPDSVGFFGLRTRNSEDGLRVVGTVYRNNPLYAAGLESDDIILAIDGKEVTDRDAFDTLIGGLRIGKQYAMRYRQNGIEQEGRFTAAADPSFKLVWQADVKKKVGERRKAWLGVE